jgi:hypothetical protein
MRRLLLVTGETIPLSSQRGKLVNTDRAEYVHTT